MPDSEWNPHLVARDHFNDAVEAAAKLHITRSLIPDDEKEALINSIRTSTAIVTALADAKKALDILGSGPAIR